MKMQLQEFARPAKRCSFVSRALTNLVMRMAVAASPPRPSAKTLISMVRAGPQRHHQPQRRFQLRPLTRHGSPSRTQVLYSSNVSARSYISLRIIWTGSAVARPTSRISYLNEEMKFRDGAIGPTGAKSLKWGGELSGVSGTGVSEDIASRAFGGEGGREGAEPHTWRFGGVRASNASSSEAPRGVLRLRLGPIVTKRDRGRQMPQ